MTCQGLLVNNKHTVHNNSD